MQARTPRRRRAASRPVEHRAGRFRVPADLELDALLSEFELIAAIRERLAAAAVPSERPGLVLGSGDDAAITERSCPTAISVDALVEDVHFRLPPFTLANVGHKALAAALSDLAAMGAEPAEAYVQLGLPKRHQGRALELADGLAAVAAEAGVAVAGGDVTRSPMLFLALTVVGVAPSAGTSFVSRAGAREGEVIVLTGEVGGAAAGLLLLERPELETAVPPAVASDLRARQLEPWPRLAAGRLLAAHGASAMIDLSDGLAGDAAHLAAASGVALEIDLERVPVAEGVGALAAAAGRAAEDLSLAGGEDYELLATIPAERERDLRRAAAEAEVALTVIGRAEAGSGAALRLPGGGLYEANGFDQLRARRAPSGPA